MVRTASSILSVLLCCTGLASCSETSHSPEPDAAPADRGALQPDAAGDTATPPPEMPTLPAIDILAELGERENARTGDPSQLILGSTGRRLWANWLDAKLGLSGCFNYIHEDRLGGSNLAWELLAVRVLPQPGEQPAAVRATAHRYHPDRLELDSEVSAPGLALQAREAKWITADDCAVAQLQLHNAANSAAQLTLAAEGRLMHLAAVDGQRLAGAATFHGFDTHFAFSGPDLAPEERPRTVSAAFNPVGFGYPAVSASHTFFSDSPWSAVDGSLDPASRWTGYGSGNDEDWLEIDFGDAIAIDEVVIHFYDDAAIGGHIRPPLSVALLARAADGAWVAVADVSASPAIPAPGANALSFAPRTASALRLVFSNVGGGLYSGVTEVEVHPGVQRPQRLLRGDLTLAAGESRSLRLAFCIASSAAEVTARLDALEASADPLADHRRTYAAWFEDNIPLLHAPDPSVQRMWLYRWFVARYNLAEIGLGRLAHPAFFEGREHYSRVIQFSTPQILDETRWLRDPRFAYGHLQNLVDNQYSGSAGKFDGELPYLFANRRSTFWFINWTGQAAWGLYRVHPRADFFGATSAALLRNLRGMTAAFDADGDHLYKLGGVDGAFYATGMEFQPAFYFFADDMRLPPEQYPDVERVDFTSYVHGNAVALAEMARAEGDAQTAAELEALAVKIRQAVLDKMWHAQDRFFYDLRAADDAPARVMEIVGFYPFAFGVVPTDDEQYLAIFDHLADEAAFWTAHPVATISQKSPFFSQTNPGGCCHWNGPTWPFSNSIVLEALARAAKQHGDPQATTLFRELLAAYTREMFEGGDPKKPLVSESLNGASGAWKSRVESYFHSKYNDLLIRHVVGLTPRADDVIELDPIDIGWSHFALSRLRYHGRELLIVWDRPDDDEDAFADGQQGLSVFADGAHLFSHPRLQHLRFDPASGSLETVL